MLAAMAAKPPPPEEPQGGGPSSEGSGNVDIAATIAAAKAKALALQASGAIPTISTTTSCSSIPEVSMPLAPGVVSPPVGLVRPHGISPAAASPGVGSCGFVVPPGGSPLGTSYEGGEGYGGGSAMGMSSNGAAFGGGPMGPRPNLLGHQAKGVVIRPPGMVAPSLVPPLIPPMQSLRPPVLSCSAKFAGAGPSFVDGAFAKQGGGASGLLVPGALGKAAGLSTSGPPQQMASFNSMKEVSPALSALMQGGLV